MRLLPVLLLGAMSAGVAAGIVFVPSEWTTIPILLAGTIANLWASTRRGRLALLSALVAVTTAGAALASHAERGARDPPLASQALRAADGEVVWLTGQIATDASPAPNGARLRIAPSHVGRTPAASTGEVALTVGGTLSGMALAQWRAGRTVRVPARLRRPARYLNAGVPDHRLALARRGLVLVGNVKSAALVDVLRPGSGLAEAAATVRARVRRVLSAHVGQRNPAAGAVAVAILIGDRAALDPAIEERLQAAGTYHVIAISGGNIALLTVALVSGVRVMRVRTPWRPVIVALALVAHAGLVGADTSVTRATVMAIIYIGLSALDQRAWSLNALAAAASAMLLARPLALVDPGFLLSVGATGAIVALTTPLLDAVRPRAWWRPAAAVLAASIAAELVLLPVSATLFNRVTVAGLALNLLAVPLMAVVQFSGMALLLVDTVSPAAARAVGGITALAATSLIESARLVDWWPWLARRVPAPAPWTAVFYLVALALGFSARRLPWIRGRWRWRTGRIAPSVAALAAFWILAAPDTWLWPWRADGWLRVTSFDVGQGDATLVQFPNGQRWLIDAGGLPGQTAFDVGSRIVAPALWARGVGRLHELVLTHGDPDHVGGAAAVIADFLPRTVWEGVAVPSHEPMRTLRAQAAEAHLLWTTATSGSRAHVSGATVQVYHPAPPDWERQRVRNDDSIVLEIRYGGVSVVLPGDIGRSIEQELASAFAPVPFRVLKAAHHGSLTSTSDIWLDALRPAVAIVSCGRENPFGHPAPAVMRRLHDRDVPVFRTDQDGAITVETDGERVKVTTFTGRTLITTTKATKTRRHENRDGLTRPK